MSRRNPYLQQMPKGSSFMRIYEQLTAAKVGRKTANPLQDLLRRFESETERSAFEHFQRRSASALGPGLGWLAFGEVVLQCSDNSPVLRHATIALGAIHEHELEVSGTHKWTHDKDLLTFAYCQYGKAIRQLRHELSKASREKMILACILFTIFDFVQGDDVAAAAHLQGGLGMLRKFAAGFGLLDRSITFRGQVSRRDHPSARSAAKKDWHSPDLQHLTRMFVYLDFWSMVFSDGESLFPEVTLIDGLAIEPTIRDKDELHYKLRYIVPLQYRIHEFLRAARASSHACHDETFVTAFSSTKQDLVDRLEHWYRELLEICVAAKDNLSDEEKVRIDIATLNYKKIQTMLLACHEYGRVQYQAFDSAFQDIVSRSAAVISKTIFPMCRVRIFAFTPGVIHPLYITATRCCNAEICEQALGLLQSFQWTEGVWNSTIMAKIARRKLDGRSERVSHSSVS
ncbi:hypothetical protein PV11_06050 [Exophiala sideris]|uniref:Transcription factor domain-containing protein n=1 Tax=Exophiala sideris TaxID=1016849 RepID=A0A0D1X8E6_9EURO|nr:hypothetical protein PV11_06050 [Exophiala sideris]